MATPRSRWPASRQAVYDRISRRPLSDTSPKRSEGVGSPVSDRRPISGNSTGVGLAFFPPAKQSRICGQSQFLDSSIMAAHAFFRPPHSRSACSPSLFPSVSDRFYCARPADGAGGSRRHCGLRGLRSICPPSCNARETGLGRGHVARHDARRTKNLRDNDRHWARPPTSRRFSSSEMSVAPQLVGSELAVRMARRLIERSAADQ